MIRFFPLIKKLNLVVVPQFKRKILDLSTLVLFYHLFYETIKLKYPRKKFIKIGNSFVFFHPVYS